MRRFMLAIVVFVVAYCLIPAIMLWVGVCHVETFFRKPPSAVLQTLHCDHNIQDEGHENAMRLTSTIKTHNMVDSVVGFRMGFYYFWDGSPVLSRFDSQPIEIQRQLIVPVGKDTTLLEVSSVKYNVFPDECKEKSLRCRVFLDYKDAQGNLCQHKQGEDAVFKVR